MAKPFGMPNDIGSLSRTKTSPIPVNRSFRRQDIRVLTSMPAGKMVPLAAFPILREDKLSMSRFRLSFEMMETVEILMNAVNVNVKAYLVPFLAFERFNGIDQLNRSYMKIKEQTTDAAPVPFFTSVAFNAAGQPVHTYMGKHGPDGTSVNTAYCEAYNTIWNFRVSNRSPDIAKRALTDMTLAKAFWQHSQFAAVVPDFDQAIIDGQVSLNVLPQALPVKGIGVKGPTTTQVDGIVESTGGAVSYVKGWHSGMVGTSTGPGIYVNHNAIDAGRDQFPLVYAEMIENGITVSLSNIEMARKTQAFAALRKQYTGHTDDYIIDLLMNGITVPEQAWRQPILLADKSTIYGMTKRYASDSVDLTASVANGSTFMDIGIVTPTVPTGGIVMIVAEVTPEQLFERQADPFFHLGGMDQENLPEFLRDTLDPEKVEIVTNKQIDVDHATPDATFGYAPLNWKWNSAAPGIGGKFYRPKVDSPVDEDRNRIWAVETANPTLAEDFYLCTNMHTKPFVVTDQDPFEVVMRGVAQIEGNTVFGHALIEASDDYNAVLEDVDQDRIQKPAATTLEDVEEPDVDTSDDDDN